MAIFSPALVVAMCVMFILTRIHRHFYVFEHLFLFGLKYCLEPAQEQIDEIVKASSTSKSTVAPSKQKGKSTSERLPASSSKTKLASAPLAVRRAKLDERFFYAEAEFPYHRQLDHLMVICCGYVAAFLFEECVGCFFPDLLVNRRSAYVAMFGVGFATYQVLRISVGMASLKVMLVLGGLAWIVALFLVTAGDFINFVHFNAAFAGLGLMVEDLLAHRFSLEEQIAGRYARYAEVSGRLMVSGVAAIISASIAAPTRFFSKRDYDLHCEFREDEFVRREDHYSLGRPTRLATLRVAVDYVGPALTVFLWCVSPRPEGSYGSWRLVALLACVCIRFATMRPRLQSYLDGAIDHYRSFGVEKSAFGAKEAGHRTTVRVVTNSYYLIMVAVAYVSSAVLPLLFALVAKLDGAMRLGICPVPNERLPQPSEIFSREVAAFLSWWSLASYVAFGAMSLSYDYATDVLDPMSRGPHLKTRATPRSSERRKPKRIARQAGA